MLILSSELSAQIGGDLLITPTRLVFESNKQADVLTLVNTGSDTATFAISIIEYKMNEGGNLEQIQLSESDKSSAATMIRFFPRSVTLAPRESQTVRVQIRKPAGLAEGEYRSHIYFRSEKAVELGSNVNAGADSTALAIKLAAIYGISIPVIVRQGTLTANVSLSGIAISATDKDKKTASAKVVIHREGTKSIYGNLHAYWTSPEGNKTKLKSMKGVAVYMPLTTRIVEYDITTSDTVDLESGRVTFEFESIADADALIQASASLDLK